MPRSKTPLRKARSRSASPCKGKKLMVRRKSYTRKDGVYVKATTYCITDRGTPGKQSRGARGGAHSKEKPWIQREGKLGGPGYLSKTAAARHKLLDSCVSEYGYASCLGSVNVLNRNASI